MACPALLPASVMTSLWTLTVAKDEPAPVIALLLVIFIITTAPSVNDLDLNLPDPNAPKKGPSNIKPNVISVSGEGKVFLNQKEMDWPTLKEELVRMRRADKDVTVIVRGHPDVEYQTMIKIFDTLQQADVDLLEKYDRLVANDYCRPGCGACLSSCPYEVPINDVLRYAMYYENYSQQRAGMEAYARIPAAHNASQCVDCKAPCQQACPFEIPIKEKMLRADRLLRFSS